MRNFSNAASRKTSKLHAMHRNLRSHTQRIALIASVSTLLLTNTKAASEHYEYEIAGNPQGTTYQPTEGALMLMGGGGFVDDAFRWFIQKAGGGRIVVLAASDKTPASPKRPPSFDYGKYLLETIGGCASVERIVFKDREASHDPEVLKVIRQAHGIFLSGGAQSRYADYWKATPVAEALDAHVRAGRPLGGSSAGLAVLGDWCYTAHVTARVTGEIALADPFDSRLTFESDLLHLEMMRGVITETHFSNRKREGRLMTFLARYALAEPTTPLIGIGVDEKAVLCLEPKGRGRVMTAAPQARAWLYFPQHPPAELAAGQPLTYYGVKVFGAGPESIVDLSKRRVEKPAAQHEASAISGQLKWTPEKP